ncbi:MAG: hypothetical protein K2X94_01245 [Amoebophilaceae bacterium]|nr:hypothetical protein [Amoebophilaceae bacterium]
MPRSLNLIIGLFFFFDLLPQLRAVEMEGGKNTIATIEVVAESAIQSELSYLRWAKWLCPKTRVSWIYKHIVLKPGAVFYESDLLDTKQRLLALGCFAKVSVHKKNNPVENDEHAFDILIQTKDAFPITAEVNISEGALCTITHNHVGGYGHKFIHQFFLKKRWGYGLGYEWPQHRGRYLLGGQYYKQIGEDDLYSFRAGNVWLGKTIAITRKMEAPYGIVALADYTKKFLKPPVVTAMYHNYNMVLAHLGLVDNRSRMIKGVYTLHKLESLPSGGSLSLLYGYQMGESNTRHYLGFCGIKNIITSSLGCLHLACEMASFLNKKKLEEGIVKLALDYVGPHLSLYNVMRQFISVSYITGYRMAEGARLALGRRDPEALEEPSAHELCGITQPIQTRLNLYAASLLHRPLLLRSIYFAGIAFGNYLLLYDRNYTLINATLVDNYGIGVRFEHFRKTWPTVELSVAYSPLGRSLKPGWGHLIPMVSISMCGFKNIINHKPTLVQYS